MRRTALIACSLLLIAASCSAATADELWQDYQKKPAVVSTQPVKPTERREAAPAVTVEAEDGTVTTPTTPDEALNNADVHDTAPASTSAQDADAGVENQALDTAESAKAVEAEPQTASAAKAQSQTKPAAEQPPARAEAVKAKANAPVVSNKPVADKTKPKPKPKLQLVGKPPLPRQFMRTPQLSDFASMTSVAGGYSLSLPLAFGTDPLAGLPQTEGAMLVRTKDDTLMCAVNVIDPTDAVSFNAVQPLPTYENAKLHWSWQQEADLTWDVKLSSHSDFHGEKMLLEAQAQQAGKTYQMLFVMPSKRYTELLPQAAYALSSFKLNNTGHRFYFT